MRAMEDASFPANQYDQEPFSGLNRTNLPMNDTSFESLSKILSPRLRASQDQLMQLQQCQNYTDLA